MCGSCSFIYSDCSAAVIVLVLLADAHDRVSCRVTVALLEGEEECVHLCCATWLKCEISHVSRVIINCINNLLYAAVLTITVVIIIIRDIYIAQVCRSYKCAVLCSS